MLSLSSELKQEFRSRVGKGASVPSFFLGKIIGLMCVLSHFQHFIYIMAISFSGGGVTTGNHLYNYNKSLTNVYHIRFYQYTSP
jgi:hypothetical protein